MASVPSLAPLTRLPNAELDQVTIATPPLPEPSSKWPHIHAAKHERTASRTTQSNGTRDKAVATAAGDVTVKMD